MTIEQMEKEIRALIAEHAPRGTKFKWSNARSAFGHCAYKYNRDTGRYGGFIISISKPLATQNDWETVRKTVIHEIAHANTPSHHHDRVWRRECIRLGGDGERCYTSVKRGGDVNTIPYKYIGVCPKCGAKFPRFRRTEGYHCDRNVSIVWKLNDTRVA